MTDPTPSAALAQPEPALPQPPECLEFALNSLSASEEYHLREYIEQLKARAALATEPVGEPAPPAAAAEVGMAETIRPALNQLVKALDDYDPKWDAFPEAELTAARAALAQPEHEVAGLTVISEECRQLLTEAMHIIAEEWGHTRELESMRPFHITSVSGFLEKARAVLARFGNHSPGAGKMVSPAPAPAEGEVGKLVAKLRRLALQNPLGTADPTIYRAAALIEQQTAELALLRQLAGQPPTQPTIDPL